MIERRSTRGLTWLERPGGGVPLVFLHGIGANAAAFLPFLDRLQGNHRLLAWDAPGYGGSAPLAGAAPSAGDFAAALAKGLDELGAERCVMVGHSLGCLIVGRLAVSRPRLVSGVLFAAPALGLRAPPQQPLPPVAQSRLDDFERLGADGLARTRAPHLLAAANRTPHLLDAVGAGLRALTLPGYAQATHLLATGDLIADSALLRCRARVATGNEDEITPVKGGDRLAAALGARPDCPPTRHDIVAGAGHMLFDEAPQDMARLIAAFMAELD